MGESRLEDSIIGELETRLGSQFRYNWAVEKGLKLVDGEIECGPR